MDNFSLIYNFIESKQNGNEAASTSQATIIDIDSINNNINHNKHCNNSKNTILIINGASSHPMDPNNKENMRANLLENAAENYRISSAIPADTVCRLVNSCEQTSMHDTSRPSSPTYITTLKPVSPVLDDHGMDDHSDLYQSLPQVLSKSKLNGLSKLGSGNMNTKSSICSNNQVSFNCLLFVIEFK